MSPIDLFLKWARRDIPDIDANQSEIAARAILYDCKDRRGIKHQFEACDEEVIKEILDTWTAIIKACHE
jgi:hypothetical protein